MPGQSAVPGPVGGDAVGRVAVAGGRAVDAACGQYVAVCTAVGPAVGTGRCAGNGGGTVTVL